jgi:hypothetical protein
MRNRSGDRTLAHPYRAAAFWDEVEECVESLDWRDFLEFASADALPFDAPDGFRIALREQMRSLVRRLYQS